MKKKLIALMLVASMGLSMLACGTEATTSKETSESQATTSETVKTSETVVVEEPVEIAFWNLDNSGTYTDVDTVVAAVNEYIKDKINVTISFKNAAQDTIELELATTNNIDLIWYTGTSRVENLAKQGGLLDISDMIQNYEALYSVATEEQWESMMMDGKLYAVPCMKEAFTGLSYMTTASMAEQVKNKTGLDFNTIEIQSVRDMANLTPYLAAVSDINNVMESCKLWSFADLMKVDPVYSVVNSGVGLDSSTGKIVDLYATKEYADYLALVREWCQNGWVLEGRAAGTVKAADTKPYLNGGYPESGTYGIHTWTTTPDNVNNASNRYGMDALMCEIGERYILSDTMFGSCWVISSKSEKADACLKFLELLNTDSKLADIWTYGVEGKHFNYTADGRVERIADSGYSQEAWKSASVFKVTPLSNENANKGELYEKENAMAVMGSTAGFRYDTASTSAEISALKAVGSEYVLMLEYGVYDPNEYLQKFLDARKKAGVEKIISDMQAQYDAWVAGK